MVMPAHWALTVRRMLVVPLHPFVSVAFTVAVNVPVCVGAPDRTPAGDRVRPGGRVPSATLHTIGATPPFAWSVTDGYAVPTTGVARNGAAIVIAGQAPSIANGTTTVAVQLF